MVHPYRLRRNLRNCLLVESPRSLCALQFMHATRHVRRIRSRWDPVRSTWPPASCLKSHRHCSVCVCMPAQSPNGRLYACSVLQGPCKALSCLEGRSASRECRQMLVRAGEPGEMRKHMEHTLSCPANLDKLGSVQELPEEEGIDSPNGQQPQTSPSAEDKASSDAEPAVAWDFDAPKVGLLCKELTAADASMLLMTTILLSLGDNIILLGWHARAYSQRCCLCALFCLRTEL